MLRVVLALALSLPLVACSPQSTQIVNVNQSGEQDTEAELDVLVEPLTQVVEAINKKDSALFLETLVAGSPAAEGIIVLDVRRMTETEVPFSVKLGSVKETSRGENSINATVDLEFSTDDGPLGKIIYDLSFQQEGNRWKIYKFESVGGDRTTVERTLKIG